MSKQKQGQDVPTHQQRHDSTPTLPHQSERPAPTYQIPNLEKTFALNKNSSSDQIVTACEGKELALFTSMITDKEPLIHPKTPTTKLEKEPLYIIKLRTVETEYEELQISALQDYCLEHPHALVRDFASRFKLNLNLFDQNALKCSYPTNMIDCLLQTPQDSDRNVDPDTGLPDWISRTDRQRISLKEYHPEPTIEGGKLISGANMDLPKDMYGEQYKELNKLPAFCKVDGERDMISKFGYSIEGINTAPVVFMMVPFSRRTGWLDSFCSVNINTGPGACEWFLVSHEYSSIMAKLCKKNEVNLSGGSWWPNLQELMAEGVPVSRFRQNAGDMVWINAGGIQWAQSEGFCNLVAWNVGPITHRQYYTALERYEWNKVHDPSVKLLPMIHLTWNLARTVKVSGDSDNGALYDTMRECLFRSLTNVCMQREFVKKCLEKEPTVHYQIEEDDTRVYNCEVDTCEVEVFNILYIKPKDWPGLSLIYCIDCARKISSELEGFDVLELYEFEDLCEDYDKFIKENGRGVFSKKYTWDKIKIDKLHHPSTRHSLPTLPDSANRPSVFSF